MVTELDRALVASSTNAQELWLALLTYLQKVSLLVKESLSDCSKPPCLWGWGVEGWGDGECGGGGQ